MLLTNDMIKNDLKDYSNKNSKIGREVKKGNLIKIINGLYETNKNVEGYLLASSIYGPSYLSFDFALYYYGLIPEKVTVYTSATCEKKKKKIYNTNFGIYSFRDVPKLVYPLGVRLIQKNEYTYQIATPEKAVCDKLYTLPPIKNMKEIEMVLFSDLRIDEEEFKNLNIDEIEEIAKVYHSTNVDLLYRYMKRRAKNG